MIVSSDATMQTVRLAADSLNKETTEKTIQKADMKYYVYQNTRVSMVLCGPRFVICLALTVFQALVEPLLLAIFSNYGPPAKANEDPFEIIEKLTYLPLTFLTVQKSNAQVVITRM